LFQSLWSYYIYISWPDFSIYSNENFKIQQIVTFSGDHDRNSKSTHDKIEEKLKSCTETDSTAEQVDTTTYQGMH